MECWNSRLLIRAQFSAILLALLPFHVFPWGDPRCCHHSKHQHPADFSVYNYLSIQGPNSTTGYNAVLCGHANQSQAYQFGQVYCFDMPLLSEQDLSSELLGRVYGTFTLVDQQAASTLFVSETFVLNTTTNNGTFSALGLEHVGQVTTKPIVGGTMKYNFTTGIATTTPLAQGTDSNGNFFTWFLYNFTFHT